MQVQLKQAEITSALKQYISGQGISLQGKTVKMAFTAGRKESGITVEILIDDAGIPDFFKGESEDKTQVSEVPALSLVKDTAPTTSSSTAEVDVAADQDEGEAFFEPVAETVVPGDEGNVVQAEPVTLLPTGKSLFN